MNILLFVTCFMLILSSLTYAKMDSFRYFLATEAELEHYMQSIENAYGNQVAKNWYDTTIAKRQTAASVRSVPGTKAVGPSSPRLGFRILIDTEMQRKNPQAYALTEGWMKSLIHKLYGDYPFYQEALKKHPSFVDALLENIKRTVETLPLDKRPKHGSELANLTLDKEYEDIFYLMLKGCPTLDASNTRAKSKQPATKTQELTQANPNPNAEENEDEAEIAEAALEYSCPESYDSLLNYISLFNGTAVRVYLAPKEVLEAIFGSSEVASAILQNRYQLYQSVLQGMPAEDASVQFKALFQGHLKGSDADLLDFRVSKTNPTRYD